MRASEESRFPAVFQLLLRRLFFLYQFFFSFNFQKANSIHILLIGKDLLVWPNQKSASFQRNKECIHTPSTSIRSSLQIHHIMPDPVCVLKREVTRAMEAEGEQHDQFIMLAQLDESREKRCSLNPSFPSAQLCISSFSFLVLSNLSYFVSWFCIMLGERNTSSYRQTWQIINPLVCMSKSRLSQLQLLKNISVVCLLVQCTSAR